MTLTKEQIEDITSAHQEAEDGYSRLTRRELAELRRLAIAGLEADALRERAEKAERFVATADSEWKARAEKAERERDEARAERDRRPDISAEDAALHTGPPAAAGSVDATDRIYTILRAHAQKAVKP